MNITWAVFLCTLVLVGAKSKMKDERFIYDNDEEEDPPTHAGSVCSVCGSKEIGGTFRWDRQSNWISSGLDRWGGRAYLCPKHYKQMILRLGYTNPKTIMSASLDGLSHIADMWQEEE